MHDCSELLSEQRELNHSHCVAKSTTLPFVMHWFTKAIIYHIFIDRFAGVSNPNNETEDSFCCGNLNGIKNRLNHVKSTGANTIWISPFYSSSAYHGYHITDFKEVDPNFGNISDLQDLIQTCKSNEIRLITDIVPNHCSNQHPWFIDAKRNKKSKFRDWFYFNSSNNYLNFMGFDELPKLNLENSETAEWLIENFCSWAEIGFDGFRIDHVLGIPDKFLSELNRRLKQVNPDFVLIGEAWGEGMKYKYMQGLKFRNKHACWKKGFKQVDLQNHYSGILDGVLDFGWRNLLLDNLQQIKYNPGGFSRKSLNYSRKYPENFVLPRFLDNHDTSRIMHVCKQSDKLFTNLLRILFSQEQPVILYYGTEFGLSHTNMVGTKTANSDIQARGLINWEEQPRFLALIKDLSDQRKFRYS